jgi:thioredoxin reductase (NADPH)
MRERAANNPKIDFIWDSVVTEVLGEKGALGHKKLNAVKIKNVKTGAITDFKCDGLFLAIGHQPNTKLFQGKLEMDQVGYLITKPHSTATNVPGVFAAGDVADPTYRQAVSAAGTGCMAAIDAERFLVQEGHD